jgi:hypothetical protein
MRPVRVPVRSPFRRRKQKQGGGGAPRWLGTREAMTQPRRDKTWGWVGWSCLVDDMPGASGIVVTRFPPSMDHLTRGTVGVGHASVLLPCQATDLGVRLVLYVRNEQGSRPIT